ncbi:MAG: GntR family transcriptional regulator [Gammaproteobacteria bacterium]|nr:GntR family transcriptional regulator [Gammaproteobacteria bacterium]
MTRSLPLPESSNEHSKSERVYRDLRRRIRQMDLQPGSRLRKNEIAVEYGVSRAPVSEAIARLAEEGLVDVFPQSGSFVAPIRPDQIRECFLIRTGLEVEAVRRVTQQADAKFMEQLDENLKSQAAAIRDNNMELLDDLDEAFHATIFLALKSPRAKRLIDVTRAVLDRPRFHSLHRVGRADDTLTEHSRIVDAIRTGDVELAGAAMRLHITTVAHIIENDVAQTEKETRLKSVK